MTDIYAQHDAAFSKVSAHIILRDGQKVATVAIKFPKDGAGRLYAYVHWLGTEMVRGSATGYGYDKRTAAMASAIHAVHTAKHALMFAEPGSPMEAFTLALAKDSGHDWTRQLETAGFTVLQAI